MRTVIKSRQHLDQSEPPDRPPTDVFNESVRRVGMRGNQHRAAGVLAVVKCKKQAAPLVPLFLVVCSYFERPAFQLHQSHKYTEQITQMPEWFEPAVRDGADVRRESHAQQVEGKNRSRRMTQPQQIDASLSFR